MCSYGERRNPDGHSSATGHRIDHPLRAGPRGTAITQAPTEAIDDATKERIDPHRPAFAAEMSSSSCSGPDNTIDVVVPLAPKHEYGSANLRSNRLTPPPSLRSVVTEKSTAKQRVFGARTWRCRRRCRTPTTDRQRCKGRSTSRRLLNRGPRDALADGLALSKLRAAVGQLGHNWSPDADSGHSG